MVMKITNDGKLKEAASTQCSRIAFQGGQKKIRTQGQKIPKFDFMCKGGTYEMEG